MYNWGHLKKKLTPPFWWPLSDTSCRLQSVLLSLPLLLVRLNKSYFHFLHKPGGTKPDPLFHMCLTRAKHREMVPLLQFGVRTSPNVCIFCFLWVHSSGLCTAETHHDDPRSFSAGLLLSQLDSSLSWCLSSLSQVLNGCFFWLDP